MRFPSLSHPTHRALLAGFVAYFLWATGDALVKIASDWGAKPLHITTLMGLGNSLIVFLCALFTKRLAALRPKAPKLVWIRALIAPVMSIGFYTSYTYLPLVNAYALEFTAPFVIALGGSLFLKERLSKAQYACIALGFLGGLLAIDFAHLWDQSGTLIGYGGAFIGTAMFAATQLLSRHLSDKEDPLALMITATSVCSVVGLALCGDTLFALPLPAIWMVLFAGAVSLLGGYLMIVAMRFAQAGIVSALHYVQLIPGALFGYLFWRHIPSLTMLAGSAVIMLAAFLLAKTKKQG